MTPTLITRLALIVLQWTSTVIASPSREARDINNQQIVGQASNIIASTILKANVDSSKNYAFSPLGYSTLLAILGEGAKEEARKDIALLLKHPEEPQTGFCLTNFIGFLQPN